MVEQYFVTFISFSTSFIFGLLILPEVIKVIVKNKVFDTPGGRKIHVEKHITVYVPGDLFITDLMTSILWGIPLLKNKGLLDNFATSPPQNFL